jgi:GntR family transcriptional regulator/MocR family aminotransferase
MLICSGFTQALSLITQALPRPVVAIEDPGLPGREAVIAAAGGTHLPIPVDTEGARVDALAAGHAHAVVVTPAHHFPLGVAMAPGRRERLLAWAAGNGRLIVEDDYDAEFRYDRQPLGALHGLAPDHVAYVGTTSKTLSPALRLAWIVLPPHLVGPVCDAKQHHDVASGIVEQLALARLIESGVYERHLRRLRRLYRHRRDTLLAALHRHLPSARVTGAAAGLHLMLALPGNADPQRVADIAARDGLALTPLDRYRLHAPAPGGAQLVLGYGNIAAAAIPEAAQRLRRAVVAAGRD